MISVIIPYHNNYDTIDKAVGSALGQSYKDIEIIIIDNGSDIDQKLDETHFNDSRIIVKCTEQPLGAAGARNEGIKLAKGDYIAFLDADDLWAPDKLDKQLKVMERYTYKGESPIICFTGRELVDDSGKPTGRYIGCEKLVNYRRLLRTNQISCSSVLIRRKDMEKYTFPDGNLHEDYVVWLELLKDGGYAAGINRPLLSYRVSRKSRSGNKLKSAMMNYRVYRYIGLSLPESLRHMVTYTVQGFKKHYF